MRCFHSWNTCWGHVTGKQQQLVQTACEVIRIERLAFVPGTAGRRGRPPKDRAAPGAGLSWPRRSTTCRRRASCWTGSTPMWSVAADLRLRSAEVGGAERVGLLARLRRIRRHEVAPARARNADPGDTAARPAGGPPLPRLGAAIEAREKPATKEKPANPGRPNASGGGLKKGEERPKILTRLERRSFIDHEPAGDARRPADRLRCRHEEEQQGLQGHLGRLQAAHRRGRRTSDSDQLRCWASAYVHDSQTAFPLADFVRRADEHSV